MLSYSILPYLMLHCVAPSLELVGTGPRTPPGRTNRNSPAGRLKRGGPVSEHATTASLFRGPSGVHCVEQQELRLDSSSHLCAHSVDTS